LRNTEGFYRPVIDATKPTHDLAIQPSFQNNSFTNRKKKTHFDYEENDDNIQDPKENFKFNLYDITFDIDI